ncbi:S-adenosyl-L-methionine-dependent methyltransferase [Xylariomycetidae sp. FL0641]|nr:S-adenosyl-L-methionine-dependent methyltransferase [Xylariomycetidae sp. FL0641]
MFTIRNHVRKVPSPSCLIAAHLPSTCRRINYLEKHHLQPTTPLAERLAATGTWDRKGRKTAKEEETPAPKKKPGRPRKTAKRDAKAEEPAPPVKGDKTRVNVVSEKLCDDVFSYIGKTLKRHKGCDILDLNPGAGLWSTKLNDFLEPRSHILLEPDAALYTPFLQPLLDRPGTRLVPKSGLIWRELNEVLTPEYLPHQTPRDPSELGKRNNTLLVTGNLAFHPKKKFATFDSLAVLVLNQFIKAISTAGFFQRYGTVRMLLWTRSDDTPNYIPRTVQRRRRSAIETEFSCEWLAEVCGGGDQGAFQFFRRDEPTTFASAVAALRRTRAAGLKMPAERESKAVLEARGHGSKKIPVAGTVAPFYDRPWAREMAALDEQHLKKPFDQNSIDFQIMRRHHWRDNWESRKHQKYLDLVTLLNAVRAAERPGAKTSAAAKKRARDAFREATDEASSSFLTEWYAYRDNVHICAQDPPVLHYDRRPYEAMTVQDEEFFPNVPCSLLDIQPQDVHPLLRQTGPRSNRAADMFELLMGSLLAQASAPVHTNLDALWPGAADYIVPRWTSGQDMQRGGFIFNLPHAEPNPRILNTRQWTEMLELWMEWPFRPEFTDLIARTQEDDGDKLDLFSTGAVE